MEVYVQVSVQLLVLLLSKTKTPTTGGLTTLFDQKLLGFDPTSVFILSTSWSLLSCVRTHTKIIAIDKGFCKMTSKLFIFLWGLFATLRRVLSLVALFIPSMGIFSLLHHWEWDKVPFTVRKNFAVRNSLISNDQIKLFGLNETIFWSDLDKWDYTDPKNPIAPPYSTYTLFSLRETFQAATILLSLHILAILVVKIVASREFRRSSNKTNKLVHILENVNYATPFSDWDEGDHTIPEYELRYWRTVKEMLATFTVNIITTGMMLIPLWYTGHDLLFTILQSNNLNFLAYQVNRSHYTRTFTGLKSGEETSYENSQQCLIVITSSLCVFSLMEVVGYFIYLTYVSTSRFY